MTPISGYGYGYGFCESTGVALDFGCILTCRTALGALGFRVGEFLRAPHLKKTVFTRKHTSAAATKQPKHRKNH